MNSELAGEGRKKRALRRTVDPVKGALWIAFARGYFTFLFFDHMGE